MLLKVKFIVFGEIMGVFPSIVTGTVIGVPIVTPEPTKLVFSWKVMVGFASGMLKLPQLLMMTISAMLTLTISFAHVSFTITGAMPTKFPPITFIV